MIDLDEDDDNDSDKSYRNDEEWENEDENVQIRCLFSETVFTNTVTMIDFEKDNYGFDLSEVIANDKFNEVELIMMINYIRHWTQINNSENIKTIIDDLKASIKLRLFNEDKFMMPVIDNDPLLYLVHNISGAELSDDDATAPISPDLNIEQIKQNHPHKELLSEAMNGSYTIADHNNSSYFDSYFNVHIHETMLQDTVRMKAYSEALSNDYMKDKVVLDVGCGTGILCLLAARAGAKKVIGVEYTNISDKATQIVERNNLSHIITIVKGDIEHVKLPLGENEKVDIIISEWMGYGLYYENMLSSVLKAKKYLSHNGLILPDIASLFIQGMTSQDPSFDRLEWWSDIHGFDLSDMAEFVTSDAQVEYVNSSDICTNRNAFHTLEISAATDADLDFVRPFTLEATSSYQLKAFVISFDVFFSLPNLNDKVCLTTSAEDIPTHWKQVALWLTPVNRYQIVGGSIIIGQVTYKRSTNNKRGYVIDVKWNITTSNETPDTKTTDYSYYQSFLLV